MSLISIIATDKFISFVGDGRATNLDGSIAHENYQKVFKITDKIIIGMAGSAALVEALMPRIKNNPDIDLENAKSCAHSLFDILGNGKVDNKDISLLIGGLDDLNRIYYAGFIQNSTTLEEISLNTYGIRCASTVNDQTLQLNPNLILQNLISNSITTQDEFSKFNTQSAFKIQEKFNYFISENDKSVNNNLTHEIIFKL
ncbi:hypothetical protein E8M24_32055 [Bacillus thuringiensis]|uniref:hypothetical protein n=1 Tax=Bacillus thuringiensis TaxID=1428 RepID=UPI00125EA4AA|nr:hypothetical protein [Bacillus thuringiensis]KAB5625053.1 hypothetical protein E8M24_32055 [Bacillus thuringiensis]HDR5270637.1 hypothetical protein [Bacillus thuringiensis]